MLCERCVQGNILEGDFTGRMEDGAYIAPAPRCMGTGLVRVRIAVLVSPQISHYNAQVDLLSTQAN